MHTSIHPSKNETTTARGERLKEATVEAKRVIDQYRQEKEKQFEDYVKSVRGLVCVLVRRVGSKRVGSR